MAQEIVLSGSLIFNQDGSEVGRITPSGDALQISSSLNISGSLILDGQNIETRLDTLEAGQSGDELTFGNLLAWTGSTDYRLDSIETSTGSINAFTGSYNTGSFTGSFKGDGTNLDGVTAATASFIEFDNIANKPNGLISRSAQISDLGFISGSPELEATASSHESRLDTLEIKTGSLDSEQTIQDSRLSTLETKTGSLDSEQTLQDARLASLETESGSLDGRVTTLESSDTYKM